VPDPIDEIRRSIVDFDPSDQKAIATFAMRNLDNNDRRDVMWDTDGLKTSGGLSLEKLAAYLATFVVTMCLVLLALTIVYAPDYAEYVGGVITTLTGAVAGFIGGRATAGNEPTGGKD